MKKILVIDCCIREEKSATRKLYEKFLSTLKTSDVEIEKLYLMQEDLVPFTNDDIVLRDGDVITIPEYNGSVRVMGAVTYPNTITFKEKKDLKYYINASGGFEKYARKKKSFVIYMNGMVATGKRAEVRPGCIIIVPAKTVSNAEPIKWNEVIGMLSSSASTAAVVLSAISLSNK